MLRNGFLVYIQAYFQVSMSNARSSGVSKLQIDGIDIAYDQLVTVSLVHRWIHSALFQSEE